ncbi:hypothetical protein LNN38_04430 [Pseudomonas sp. LA21]|uniref:hypothetical protein n=1 Tax=unclassified Pseudomonas TaxID=196821 RepID=UPI001FB64BAA|nr:hypothetical protein [Pseudomonas sp. LA21]MCJ1884086.1 hypothetical protein [Pseudomonas sp. LA21]
MNAAEVTEEKTRRLYVVKLRIYDTANDNIYHLLDGDLLRSYTSKVPFDQSPSTGTLGAQDRTSKGLTEMQKPFARFRSVCLCWKNLLAEGFGHKIGKMT